VSHPIEGLYKSTINDIVKRFFEFLPQYLNKDNDLDDKAINSYVDDYERLWTTRSDEMMACIARDISHYLNYYNVYAKGSIDEFKAVYFTGRVISRFLNKDGLNHLREVNDYLTIALMDYRLYLSIGCHRDVLTKSMREIE